MTLDIDISHGQGSFRLEADLRIGRGLTALFGPSGSGKTTLVNLVAGIICPEKGRIVFDGDVWADRREKLFVPPHKRRVGYVFQEGRLFPHMSVRQNLRYGLRLAPRPVSQDEFERVVDMLGIESLLDRRPARLSGGEKQRVALGRALLSSPRLLLMDEPLSALDNDLKAAILPYIERIRDEADIPILYVSHSIEEVARLATRVVAVSGGRTTAVGAPGEILHGVPAIEGVTRPGNFLHATVTEQHPDEGLTMAQCRAGALYLRHVALEIGAEIRVFVPSSDIVIAAAPVEALSTLNRLPGLVEALNEGEGGISVTIDCHGEHLTAEVTARSAKALALAPGKPVTLLFKALSVGGGGLFRHPAGH